MKKIVIIGAGQTGRGYVARYLGTNNNQITFIDRKPQLIEKLNQDRSYRIHFYSQDRSPISIHDFQAALSYSEMANEALKQCDWIITSTGEQNLDDVAKQIALGIKDRTRPLTIFTCENGIAPAKVLKKSLIDLLDSFNYLISQIAIFTTTVDLKLTRLDILSQNETFFPYDLDAYPKAINIEGAVGIHHFDAFLQRKIYTYNTIAGLISYFGYLKGYQDYAQAANDVEISALIVLLLKDLNPALSQYFVISKTEQEAFSKRAVDKFKDQTIIDYTIKNGRAAVRKLGPNERIIGPLKILADQQRNTRILELLAAAALVYWEERQGIDEEPMITVPMIDLLGQTSKLTDEKIIEQILYFFNLIKANRSKLDLAGWVQND